MTDIKYKIEFFNEWHAGSGLSAGADVDSLVIKDKNNLPVIPGKTMKGLIRQALEEIILFKNESKLIDVINKNFGLLSIDDNDKSNVLMLRGEVFFTNAVISDDLQKKVLEDNLSEFFYRSVSSTAITENGVAKKNSLRKIQTTIPCVLYGEVLGVDDKLVENMKLAFGYIKRLGVSRNRGLGRCNISMI